MKPVPKRTRLYFEAPHAPEPASNRALLVTHSFPPDPEVGGLRWQQMLRHFADRGWAFDVLARDFETVNRLDSARLATLPPGTRVYSVAAGDPLILGIQRAVLPILRRLRRFGATREQANAAGRASSHSGAPRLGTLARAYHAWMIFAREGRWARAAARAGIDLAGTEAYCLVISSGPPHMAHVAARRIALKGRLPYVVDMRDPWSLVQRSGEETNSPVWRYLARRYERRVMAGAALVTMNTEPAAEAMQTAYPGKSARIHVIRNGCDDETLPAGRQDGRFTVRFAGSIYIDRDPRLVFRAARRLIKELDLTPAQFAIEFVGDVDRFGGTPTMDIAREEGVEAFVSLQGLLKRADALAFLAGATMLLSLPQDSDFAIPAKIYEYLRFDAWMLVLSHRQSATARLLDGTDADVLEPEDVDGIARVLRRRYEQFRGGEMPVANGRDGRFDRRAQSERLMALLEDQIFAQRADWRHERESSSVATHSASSTARSPG